VRKVQVAPSPGGGTEFRHGPARAPGAAAGWSLATLIFGAGALLSQTLGAPLLIVATVGLFTAILVLLTADLWLGVTTIEFTHGRVSHRHAWLGVGRTRSWDSTQIREVRVRTGMTQQRTATQKARLWYDIEFDIAGRPPRPVLRHLPTRDEADAVASEMSLLLGARLPGRA